MMISQGRPVFSLPTLCAGICILLSTITSGCAKNGATRWATLPIPVYSDTAIIATSAQQSDLQDAMSFWEQQAGRKIFEYKGVWTSSSQPYTGTAANPGTILGNVIFFQNPWPASSNIIGQTVVTSYEDEIQHAMIMINPDAQFCTGDCHGQEYYANSARKNLAHELGHFIGLKHNDQTSNVMYPVLQPGGSMNGLSIDQTALMELMPD